MLRILLAGLLFGCLYSQASAEIQTKTIEYQVGGVTCKGYLAYDDSVQGKRPGVLVVHEWWGLDSFTKRKTEQLAKSGFVAFAVDLYGEGQITDQPQKAGQLAGAVKKDREVWLARAKAGWQVLLKQPQVEADATAAIGFCFGGTTVLEMARSGIPLRGVVSFHGDLSTSQPAQMGLVKAKVLVLHGAEDPFVPQDAVSRFMQEMRDAKANWQLVQYSGAVHSFTNPDVDRHRIDGAKYDLETDRRSFAAMRQFFEEIFTK